MEIINLTIADFSFKIILSETEGPFMKEYFKKNVLGYFKDFILINPPPIADYYIEVRQNKSVELIYKKPSGKYFVNYSRRLKNNRMLTYYQISLSQFQIILRRALYELLCKNNGIMFHSSAVCRNGRADIFMGQPGAGKSTIMNMLKSRYPALADDSTIIRQNDRNEFFYQTPFIETNDWINKNSTKYQIGNFFFLKKSTGYRMERITNKELLVSKLVKQLWTEETYLGKQLKSIFNLINKFDFYNLYFGKNSEELIRLLK